MPGPTRIVIGVDLSDAGRRAVESGASLAKDLGAAVVLVHALTPLEVPALHGGTPPLGAPGLDLAHPDRARRREVPVPAPAAGVAEWADLLRRKGVAVDTVERPGDAATLLLEEAERAQAPLVVVGRSHGGVKSALLGSVAAELVRRSRVPVLVVPDPGKPI